MDNATHSGVPDTNLHAVRLVPRTSIGGILPAGDKVGVNASFSEQFFTVCVLVFSTGAFVSLFPGEHGLEYDEQGLLFAQILWSLLYLAMLFLVRKRIVEFAHLMWQNKPLVVLLSWAGISAVWSIASQTTIRHFVALLFTSLFGIYFGVRYDLRQQVRLVSVALGIVIVASVLVCLVFPESGVGISPDSPLEEPAWHGVLTHKNSLGALAVLATIILVLYFFKRVHRPIVVIGIVLLFFVVVLTEAKTSLVYFVIGIVTIPFVRAFQRNPSMRRKIVTYAILIAAGLTMWIQNNWENFTYSLGKDPGLTGRVMLWGLAVEWIRQRPLLGFGLDAFWTSYYGPAADFRNASHWFIGATAQNGFLDLCLDLGLIGVLLFVVSFAITYRQGLKLAKIVKSPEGLWPVVFLTFLFVYSLTEFGFLSRNNLYWILYISIGIGVQSLLGKSASIMNTTLESSTARLARGAMTPRLPAE
jgi:exopolysaccharide production protein ExoQ